MRTGKRHLDLLLCGALIAATAGLSACSSGDAPAVAGATTSARTPGSTVAAPVVTSSSSTPRPPAATTTAPSPAAATGNAPTATRPAAGPATVAPPPVTARPVAGGRLVPSCKPTEFAQRAGSARGALEAYLFGPYAAGRMRGSGTPAALAVLHGGQAVRFGTQQLVVARGLLATCPRPVGGVVQALDAQVAALRSLWPVFAANHAPAAAGLTRVRAAQAATTDAAAQARMPLVTAVPTAVQIEAA
jgi:hypothetical protein